MDNKSDDHLIIMQAMIDSNRQDFDEKTKKLKSYLTAMIKSMMDQIKFSKCSPDKKYSPKDQDSTTAVPSKNKSPPLKYGHSTKIGGM